MRMFTFDNGSRGDGCGVEVILRIVQSTARRGVRTILRGTMLAGIVNC